MRYYKIILEQRLFQQLSFKHKLEQKLLEQKLLEQKLLEQKLLEQMSFELNLQQPVKDIFIVFSEPFNDYEMPNFIFRFVC
jgi:hypothetical protein